MQKLTWMLLALPLALGVGLYCGHFGAWIKKCPAFYRSRRKSKRPFAASPAAPCRRRSRKKPDWVRRDIIRLKAHLPAGGCRTVSNVFNRTYASSGMRVGKTFVAKVIRDHQYDILNLRNTWKNRVPDPEPRNHTWGVDATGKMDETGKVHAILGIVDHGSRRATALLPMRALTTVAILRILLDAIEAFGKPKIIRTDNASQFRSRLFGFVMACLGIRHVLNKPAQPWMNGRVERFFGTLKEKLNRLAVADFDGLGLALAEFKLWYNHVRPHQHLNGRTPVEAWSGIDPYRRLPKDIRYVVGWDGLLTGVYSRY